MCPQSTLPILLLLQGDHHIVLHKTLEFPMMNIAANASRGGEKRLQPTATTPLTNLLRFNAHFPSPVPLGGKLLPALLALRRTE